MIQPVVYTWANKILLKGGDDAARAITLYAMNGASSVLFAFWGIVLYPATDAPTRYHKGTIAMFVIVFLLAGWFVAVWALEKHVDKVVGEELVVRDQDKVTHEEEAPYNEKEVDAVPAVTISS